MKCGQDDMSSGRHTMQVSTGISTSRTSSTGSIKLSVSCGSLTSSLNSVRPAASSCPMWNAPARPANCSTPWTCVSAWASSWPC